MYAVTADQGAVFRTADAGTTWIRRPAIFTDAAIGELATDPFDPRVLYAAGSPSPGDFGVFRSLDGGSTWSYRSTGFSNGTISAIVLDRSAPGTIYIGTSAGGVWKSVDRAATFVPVNDGLALGVSALAIGPAGRPDLYASTQGGIFRSSDGGASWQAAGPSTQQFVRLAVAGTTPPTLYGMEAFGAWRSVDGGATWTSLSTGLTGLTTALVVDAVSPSIVYFAGHTPYYPQPILFPPTNNGVARSTDGGVTWEIRNSGLASTEITALAIDPRNPSHLFASTALGVFATNSSGVGWFSIDDGLSALASGWYGGFLAVDESVPPNLYNATPYSGVYRRGATILPSPCAADASTLCLQGGRFRARVTWSAAEAGGGAGKAVSLTADTGAFWFFTPNNLELVVKVVDGRPFNEHFWVFAGALSDVDYSIEVTDTSTGAVRTYHHTGGRPPESVGDAAAF